MFFVYVLSNKKTAELYYGLTTNLERRLREHNKNLWELIYYEAYISEKDARRREDKLKDYGQSRTHLKKRIAETLKIKN